MALTVRLFAMLRERRGTGSLNVEAKPGESVGALFARLFPANDEDGAIPSVLFAVNREYVLRDYVPEDGDEVAFIPPLAGGAADRRTMLSADPLQLPDLIKQVEGPGRGGLVTFTGTVRNNFEGRPVRHLRYEAYEEMALCEMSRLCDEIEDKWPGVAVAISHRLGQLEIGEAAVHIAAAGGHRQDSFEACRYAIDQLKQRVPIFKKEFYQDDSIWKSS
ncbi:MAG: hypothetical protein CMP23_17570 [Rickettsiales bacterium]|nr:hypothetical protein [Rickettsiales bacterium]